MSPEHGRGPSGFLCVDKETGPTSHDIVSEIRRIFRTRKVGHAGTLDPFASGLLLVAIGASTRLLQWVSALPKEYHATARLGETTETLDPEGVPRFVSDRWKSLEESALERALASFQGTMDQLPPSYSAKKVAGKPAHRRVRQGETVELSPVPVTIHTMALVDWLPPDLRFRMTCSTGTYVRSVARDLGEALGTGAYLTELRRTRIGHFDVEGAVTLEELGAREDPLDLLLSPERALNHLSQIEVSEEEAKLLCRGQGIAASKGPHMPAPGTDPPDPGSDSPGASRVEIWHSHPEGEIVMALNRGRLVAMAVRQGEQLRPRKVFMDYEDFMAHGDPGQ